MNHSKCAIKRQSLASKQTHMISTNSLKNSYNVITFNFVGGSQQMVLNQ